MSEKVRLDLLLPKHVIDFLKEEAERRTALGDQAWTWRELAWVRCSIMLEDWVNDQRSKIISAAEAERLFSEAPAEPISDAECERLVQSASPANQGG